MIMKKKLLLVILTAAMLIAALGIVIYAASTPAPGSKGEIEVWLIAGQSNAVGYGKVADYPQTDANGNTRKGYTNLTAGYSNVLFYGEDEGTGNYSKNFQATKFGLGQSSTTSGAEIGIATAVGDSGNHAIIKLAYGSSYIYPNTAADISVKQGTWTPPSYIDKYGIDTNASKVGDLYLRFVATVADKVAELEAEGYTSVIRGMWYMQGEAETFSADTSSAYSELLTCFINDVRADLSAVTDTDCSEMPFVFGRIYNNPEHDPSRTPYISTVQAQQDIVASTVSNAFAVKVDEDLLDPDTGVHTLPSQQDYWHYNAFSQQMIGEAFVRKVQSVSGVNTQYGYIPANKASASSYPFALFKKAADGYDFVDGYASYASAMTKAIDLTNASTGTEDEIVILQRANNKSGYPTGLSWIGGTITIDLGGYTIDANTSMGNTAQKDVFDENGNPKKAVINFKNGKLLMRDYGIIFAAKASGTAAFTKNKVMEFNYDNVYFGFSTDKTNYDNSDKHVDILASERSAFDTADIIYNINAVNCTFDFVSNNAKATATLGRLAKSSGDTDNSDYNVTFKGCTFLAQNTANVGFSKMGASDSVTYLKDEKGSYGKVTFTAKPASTPTMAGLDGSYETSVAYKLVSEAEGAYTYELVASGSVPTQYAAITGKYTDDTLYPYALFKKEKTEANYTFVAGYSDWKTVINAADDYILGANGATYQDEAIVLLRRDTSFSSLYTGSSIGGRLVIDLGGYTLTYNTSLMNTELRDFGTGVGGSTYIDIKNGELLCNTKYGMFYNKIVPASYTVERKYVFTFTDVRIGYAAGGTAPSLLVHPYVTSDVTSSMPNFTYEFTYNNCVIDMTGAPSGACIAKLTTVTNTNDIYNKYDDHMTFVGGRLIGVGGNNSAFILGAEDSVVFRMDENGKYTDIALSGGTQFPSSLTFDGIDADGKSILLSCSNPTKEGVYEVYPLLESIKTSYGYAPKIYEDAVKYPFFVFGKRDGAYVFDSAKVSYGEAMTRAIELTNVASGTTDDVVVLLRSNHDTKTYPNAVSDIGGTVNLDLGGFTLTARTSMGNTGTDDCGSNPKATVNISNGKLLMGGFGIVFTAAGSDGYATSKPEKTLEYNLNGVHIGYASGASTAALLLNDRSSNTTGKNAYFNMNLIDCTIDMVTNAPANSYLAYLTTSNHADVAANDYTLTMKGCTIIADSANDFKVTMSSEGDKFLLLKDNDGNYPTIKIKSGVSASGISFLDDEGNALACKQTGTDGNYTVYSLSAIGSLATAYGDIPASYASSVSYPFVIFCKRASGYEFEGGYESYKSAITRAIQLTHGTTGTESDIVVFLRTDFKESSYPTGTSRISGTVTVDLGGHTLTAETSCGNTGVQDALDASGNANDGNWIYKNGRLLMKSWGIIFNQSSAALTKEKTMNYTLEDLYIGFAPNATSAASDAGFDLLISDRTHSGSVDIIYNMNIINCTLDLSTYAKPEAKLGRLYGSSDASHADYKIVFEGCEFIIDSFADMATPASASGDSVTFKKDANGEYSTILSAEDISGVTLISSVNTPLIVTGAGVRDGLTLFALVDAAAVTTVYDDIPIEYASATIYPFVVFYKDGNGEYKFDKGYNNYKSAMERAIALTKANGTATTDEAVILLRADFYNTGFPTGISNIGATVTLDLNGYTLIAAESLGNTGAADCLASGATSAKDGTINIKNGRLLAKVHGFIYAAQSGNLTYPKTLYINFENVYVGYAPSSSATAMLIARSQTSKSGADSIFKMSFRNCTVDMATNHTAGALLMRPNSSGADDKNIFNVEFIGCTFIIDETTDLDVPVAENGRDTVIFKKGDNGYYAILKAANGISLGTTGFATPNGDYRFYQSGKDGDYTVYQLASAALAEFVPKSSITLGSELVFNIYIPKNANLTALTLDGVSLDFGTLTEKDGYYLVTVKLGASEAARDITLVTGFNVDGTNMKGTFVFSIPRYAEKVLSDSTISAVEKTLVKDVLSYIRAAYAYFGTADAVAMAKIDALLGENYDESSAPVMNGDAEKPTLGITAVTYNLTAKPGLRFYLAEGFKASDFAFSINGSAVAAEEGSDANGKYVEVKLYAYELAETVDYTVNGESDSCHIRCYYEWANTENNDNLVNLVLRFAKYCESAADYRQTVIGVEN